MDVECNRPRALDRRISNSDVPRGLEEAPAMLLPGQTLMSQVQGRGHLYPAQRTLLFLAQESDFSLLPTAVLCLSCDAVLLFALFPGSMPAPHLAVHSLRAPVFSDLFSLHPHRSQEMVPSTWQSLNYIWRLKRQKVEPGVQLWSGRWVQMCQYRKKARCGVFSRCTRGHCLHPASAGLAQGRPGRAIRNCP